MPGPIIPPIFPIGFAFFDAGGATIANLVKRGIITNVTYTSKGLYHITLSLPDTAYGVVAHCGDKAGDKIGYYTSVRKGTISTTGFDLAVYFDYRTQSDADAVCILILR